MTNSGPESGLAGGARGFPDRLKRFVLARPHSIPAAIAAVMLLAALGKWPYDYYTVMRWAVCAAAVFTAVQGYSLRFLWAIWLFGFLAVLFNPIAPIHLKRETWQVLDVAAATVFMVGMVLIRRRARVEGNGQRERD